MMMTSVMRGTAEVLFPYRLGRCDRVARALSRRTPEACRSGMRSSVRVNF
jgi:hypothetical protein